MNKPAPRIAFFLPNLTGGGAERVCINLAAEFCARGYPVDFVLAKKEGTFLNHVPVMARVLDLKMPRTISAVLPLANYLREHKPYAIIAAPDHANMVAVWANILAGEPARVISTNHYPPTLAIESTPKLQEKLYPTLLNWFGRHIDAVVSVSKGAAEDLARITRLPRRKIHVIYNPIVHAEMLEMARLPVEHPWLLDKHVPVIISAGRFEPPKDFATLVKAVNIVKQKKAVRLILLGDGSEFEKTRELVNAMDFQNEVFMPGFVSNPFSYIARSDVFVLSSHWEGFGNVLVEALACGTQVVSTDCPSGPAEILNSGEFGRLCPVADPAALAESILGAFDAPIPVEKLKLRAQDFLASTAATQYLKVMGLE